MSKWLNTSLNKHVGHILINRPEVLNAMNHQMNLELLYFLEAQEKNDACHAYLIEGVGEKAFCAGGDIRALYDYLNSPHQEVNDLLTHFFVQEYRLNQIIHDLTKPYIAILDGYVMGGGAGISINGSHPIATDKTLFSMPENKIGHFPDVGATYFFQRCPKGLGLYLALTGETLNGHEMVYANLAKAFVSSQDLDAFKQDIFDGKLIDQLLDQYDAYDETQIDWDKMAWIAKHFESPDSFETLMSRLEKDDTPYALQFWERFSKLSLLSVYLTFNKFYKNENKTLKKALEDDLFYAINITRVGDFKEGVRALIVDKDGAPDFLYKKISELEKNFIDINFKLVYDECTV